MAVRRPRRSRTLSDLRDEVEAAEARARSLPPRPAEPKKVEKEPARKPLSQPRTRVVWAVCDVGGRTVATFPYPQRDEAEAHAQQLKARNKSTFFVRSPKESISPSD